MMRKNPFAPLTKQEQEAKEQKIIEALAKSKELKEAARACLKHELFAIYEKKRAAYEAALISVIKCIDMRNPEELWKLQALQSELNAICSIMSVEKDAK